MASEEINFERFIVAKWEMDNRKYFVFKFSCKELETFPTQISKDIVSHLKHFLSPRKDPQSLRKCELWTSSTCLDGKFIIMQLKTD
jgi:hypothetical protein